MLQLNREKIWDNAPSTWHQLKGKHLFLTGGTGFFGKSLIDLINYFNEYKNLSLKITILSRNFSSFNTTHPELTNHEWISHIHGDITNFEFVEKDFDYILHFATPASAKLNVESPLQMFDVVYNGSRRVLEYAKFLKIKSMLLTSSGAVYGKQPYDLSHVPETYTGAPKTNDIGSAYGEAKRAAELLGNLYADAFGFEHKIARCFAFIGPYLDPHGSFAIGNFIKNVVKNETIVINGDGQDQRSYMYSDDLIFSLIKILIDGKNKQPYNVGSDQSISIKELAELVANTINKNINIEIKKQPLKGSVPNKYVPSIDLIKSELSLNPETTLQEAIINTATYYKKILI